MTHHKYPHVEMQTDTKCNWLDLTRNTSHSLALMSS